MVNTAVIADLCIYLLTWNVGSQYPDTIDMTEMLSLDGTSTCPGGQLPDLYVLGFQEVNVNIKNQIRDTVQENLWTSRIQHHLQFRNYDKIGAEKLQGLLINVWSLKKHLKNIDLVETSATKTGFGGWWGNKGAVSLRMSLYGTATSFVVAHLAAHDEKLQERINDYNQIVDNHQYKLRPKYRTIFDHDLVFWSGDLNFRLSGNDSSSYISNQIKKDKLNDLFARDQLQMVKESGKAFALLNETKPLFPPTFKYHVGTSDYNLKRRPAWCDRILHRIVKTNYPDMQLQQLSYKSHPQYTQSDHKPVSAEFLLSFKSK